MEALQRDMGRLEAKVEIMTEDVKAIKDDMEQVKAAVLSRKTITESDWKRLSLVATLAALITQVINWTKPFIGGT
jgi:hypothetical protein